MSVNLSDDLRHAVQTEGTPLRVVDPTTGETYVLVRESAFARAQSLLEGEAALQRAQIPNARLQRIAERRRPPQEWLEGEEEELFS
jgi:hypothetical protein